MVAPKRSIFIAETFRVVDQNGKPHTIRRWKVQDEITLLSGAVEVAVRDFKLDSTDGRHVNIDGDRMFFADDQNSILKKV